MAVSSPYLDGGDRYERSMHGWMDSVHPETFTITVRIVDPWVGVELVAETTPSPAYTIERAQGSVLVVDRDRMDPALAERVSRFAGIPMTAGFTRKVTEALEEGPGAHYFVDAAIEVARLARQLTRLPEALVCERAAEGPVGFWRLDMRGWVDLPESCYTYRPESEALFGHREIRTAMHPGLYAPTLGASRVFNRTKTARLERRDGHLLLAHSMFDEVHSFRIWYAVDAESGAILDAGSITPRLPYHGVCSDPQRNIASMVGQTLGPELRKRISSLIGGLSGCAQLYDLTADLLKLLTFE
jgi:hypothetical protein